jgi:predicted amidophosphoribosyltransferase
MVSLTQAAMDKVRAGLTTLEEVVRVVDTEEERAGVCPGCGHPIGTDYVICPACARSVVSACPGCRKPVAPEWIHCPHCRLKLQGDGAGHPGR